MVCWLFGLLAGDIPCIWAVVFSLGTASSFCTFAILTMWYAAEKIIFDYVLSGILNASWWLDANLCMPGKFFSIILFNNVFFLNLISFHPIYGLWYLICSTYSELLEVLVIDFFLYRCHNVLVSQPWPLSLKSVLLIVFFTVGHAFPFWLISDWLFHLWTLYFISTFCYFTNSLSERLVL